MPKDESKELDGELANCIGESIDDYFEKGHPDDSVKFEVSGKLMKLAKEADPELLRACIVEALATVEERHAPED